MNYAWLQWFSTSNIYDLINVFIPPELYPNNLPPPGGGALPRSSTKSHSSSELPGISDEFAVSASVECRAKQSSTRALVATMCIPTPSKFCSALNFHSIYRFPDIIVLLLYAQFLFSLMRLKYDYS